MAVTPDVLWQRWRRSRRADAFETLVKPHLPYVADLARRQGVSAADAEDVVQETLLELARERSDEPVRVGVRPWLARRVRFRAKKSIRSSVRRRRHEQAGRRSRKTADETSSVRLEVREEVEAALALLRPAERQAVVLRYLHDMDYREIAYVLGVSENAGRIKVHRGIGKLRRSLGGHAAALVAALGLPRIGEAAVILKTTSMAVATTAGATAGIGKGVLLMGTGIKFGAAVVIGAAIAAVGMMAFYEGSTAGRTEGSRGSGMPVGRSVDPDGPATTRLMAELDVTGEEAEWVKNALTHERLRRENARILPEDTGLDIIERRLKWDAEVDELVSDFDRFAGHVQAAPGKVARFEATGDVTKVNLGELAPGVAVIEFGPGTFQLGRGSRDFHYARKDIRHLEIRGAGMDQTRVVLGSSDLLTAAARVEHLRIHDLTLDGGKRGSMFLDVRGKVAAVFEKVRFKRWPSGGYSSAIGLSGGAYVGCRNCEFLGGYGHGGTGVISFRGTGIASFDRCVFADIPTTVYGGNGAAPKSVVHFERCVWENTQLAHAGLLYQGTREFPITVRGGKVHYESAKAWGRQFAQSVEAVEFSARIPRCRLSDLLRIVRGVKASLEEGQRVQGVQLVAARPEPPREFIVYLWHSSDYIMRMHKAKRSVRIAPIYVTWEGSGVKIWPEDRRRRLPNYHPGSLMEGARDIEDVVARAGLDPSMEAYGIIQTSHSTRGAATPAVELRDERARRQVVLDAVTGEVRAKNPR